MLHGIANAEQHSDKSYLNSDHEEADTKLVLQSADATTGGATSVSICSPDIDVLILAVCRYPDLCKDTSFVTGAGKHCRIMQIGPVYDIIGSRQSNSSARSACCQW